jgi:hypothetical protein
MVVVRWPGKTRGSPAMAGGFACPFFWVFFLGTCPAELREAKKTNKDSRRRHTNTFMQQLYHLSLEVSQRIAMIFAKDRED